MKKKTIFVVISSQYFYKYITLKSFKQLENITKFITYLIKKLNTKNIKIKNKIFYELNNRSSVWALYLLSFLRIANHHRCRTFKAATDWYYPGYKALKQIFKQDHLKNSFLHSYVKILIKRFIISIFSCEIYQILWEIYFTRI